MKEINSKFYTRAKKMWTTVVKSNSSVYTRELELQLELHKQPLSIFQMGRHYHMVFNIYQGNFEFVSESVKDVLGYEPQELTTSFFMDCIHPEDKTYFLNFEHNVVEFFKVLVFDKISNYKVQYDFRVKTKTGTYIRILHQAVQIDYDESNFYRTLHIQTDITHIKKEGIPCFSIIGLDGEPSYYNIQDEKMFARSYAMFTKKEREILKCVVEGKSSKTIAQELYISLHTVNTHRKNILGKANCKSPIDLITKAIRESWV